MHLHFFFFSDSIIGCRHTNLVVERMEGTIMYGHVHFIQMGCIWLVTRATDPSAIPVHPPTVLLRGLLNNHSKRGVYPTIFNIHKLCIPPKKDICLRDVTFSHVFYEVSGLLGQCFSTFLRPRPGKLFFHKTRARSQQIYSSVPFQFF